jgi:ribosomal protein L37AE/L43A
MCKSKKTGKWYFLHCWHLEIKQMMYEGSCDKKVGKRITERVWECCRCGKMKDYIDYLI